MVEKKQTTQELMAFVDLNEISKQDLEKDVKIPYVMENKILMGPGVWNKMFYSAESIKEGFDNTNWEMKEIRSLFLDHEDLSSHEWVGEIKNPRLQGENLIGDLVIVDKPTAMKLAYGAKFGISPKVIGFEEEGNMLNYKFDNFSVVINPAVKTAYINNQEAKQMADEIKPVATEEIKNSEVAVENKCAPKDELVPKKMESDEVLMNTLAEIELAGLPDLVKKAKEIKKEDESFADAIKRASKMSDMIPPTPEDIKYPKEENKPVEDEEMMKKKEDLKYPAPQAMSEVEQKMSELISKKDELIQKLSQRLDAVESKLNEPDKATMRVEELSASNQSVDIDSAFLNTLKKFGGM